MFGPKIPGQRWIKPGIVALLFLKCAPQRLVVAISHTFTMLALEVDSDHHKNVPTTDLRPTGVTACMREKL
jgi:hypothetical protein